jgi:hypothetical protein
MNNEIEENYHRRRTNTQQVVVGKPWRPPVAKVPTQVQSAPGVGDSEAKFEEKKGGVPVEEMKYERQREPEEVKGEGEQDAVEGEVSKVGGNTGEQVKSA